MTPEHQAKCQDLYDQLRVARFEGNDERITVIEAALDRTLAEISAARMDKRREQAARVHDANLGADT